MKRGTCAVCGAPFAGSCYRCIPMKGGVYRDPVTRASGWFVIPPGVSLQDLAAQSEQMNAFLANAINGAGLR